MANIVTIEDPQGEVVDINYYCSDGCAKYDPDYAGWNGCNEIHDHPQWCGTCNESLGYWRYNYDTKQSEWVSPDQQEQERLAEAQAECDKWEDQNNKTPLSKTLSILGKALAKEMEKDLR